MALFQCDFFSEVLGLSSSMTVILPQKTTTQVGMNGVEKGKRHPTLYLLHGYSDDHTIWQRRTSIERYVSSLGLAVVMPAVNKSYYCDLPGKDRYWEFISEELPGLARQFFPLSDKREDNFVAGLSMGGYGAMKLGLNYPERFAAVGSLSGVLDLCGRFYDEWKDEVPFPSNPINTINDLLYLLEKNVKSEKRLPLLYQCCGTEDFLYQNNQNFLNKCSELGIDLVYEEESGDHEWGYWDKKIQRFLELLPL